MSGLTLLPENVQVEAPPEQIEESKIKEEKLDSTEGIEDSLLENEDVLREVDRLSEFELARDEGPEPATDGMANQLRPKSKVFNFLNVSKTACFEIFHLWKSDMWSIKLLAMSGDKSANAPSHTCTNIPQ